MRKHTIYAHISGIKCLNVYASGNEEQPVNEQHPPTPPPPVPFWCLNAGDSDLPLTSQ